MKNKIKIFSSIKKFLNRGRKRKLIRNYRNFIRNNQEYPKSKNNPYKVETSKNSTHKCFSCFFPLKNTPKNRFFEILVKDISYRSLQNKNIEISILERNKNFFVSIKKTKRKEVQEEQEYNPTIHFTSGLERNLKDVIDKQLRDYFENHEEGVFLYKEMPDTYHEVVKKKNKKPKMIFYCDNKIIPVIERFYEKDAYHKKSLIFTKFCADLLIYKRKNDTIFFRTHQEEDTKEILILDVIWINNYGCSVDNI